MLERCRALVVSNPVALSNKVGAAAAVGEDRVGACDQIDCGFLYDQRDDTCSISEDADGISSMHRTIDCLIAVAEMVKR